MQLFVPYLRNLPLMLIDSMFCTIKFIIDGIREFTINLFTIINLCDHHDIAVLLLMLLRYAYSA